MAKEKVKLDYKDILESSLTPAEAKQLAKLKEMWAAAKVVKDALSASLAARIAKKVDVPAGKVIKIAYNFGLAYAFADPPGKKKEGNEGLDLS